MAATPTRMVVVGVSMEGDDAARGSEVAVTKKSSCCKKCCKCLCCCYCCCSLLIAIGLIVVFTVVLRVEAKDPPSPPPPETTISMKVSYYGAGNPNDDGVFKTTLVNSILGALGTGAVDTDGSMADGLTFEQVVFRRLTVRRLQTTFVATLTLKGSDATKAAEIFTDPNFDTSSIPNLLEISASSKLSILLSAHMLKGMNAVCKGAIGKALQQYEAEIISSVEGSNVSGATLGISEDGHVWLMMTKDVWSYNPTALGCDATEVWKKGVKKAASQELGGCKISDEGIQALVATGEGGDRCYFDQYDRMLTEGQLATCPSEVAESDSTCWGAEAPAWCTDFEYPGCLHCPVPDPAMRKYKSCSNPF